MSGRRPPCGSWCRSCSSSCWHIYVKMFKFCFRKTRKKCRFTSVCRPGGIQTPKTRDRTCPCGRCSSADKSLEVLMPLLSLSNFLDAQNDFQRQRNLAHVLVYPSCHFLNLPFVSELSQFKSKKIYKKATKPNLGRFWVSRNKGSVSLSRRIARNWSAAERASMKDN